MSSISVPFTIEGVFAGMAETQGILTFEGNSLQFEFRTSDRIFGIVKSRIKQTTLGLERIEEISFSAGIFHTGPLVVRARDLVAVKDIPNSQSGEVSLEVARKHRKVAEELASTVRFELTNRKVEEIVSEHLDKPID